jgi:hypothetical protein
MEVDAMRIIDKLERKFGRWAVPHVTLALIVAQVVMYGAATVQGRGNLQGDETMLEQAQLVPARLLAGELWRLVTFLCVPPISHPVFAFFFWYLFYMMGTALENQWGTFRYNVFFLIGYAATVAAAFVTPDQPSSNGFLQGSVFLAFAFLYPDFELFLFFILPVKIKWLALLTWVGYAFVLLMGPMAEKLLVTASVANFLMFFAPEIVRRVRYGRRRMVAQAAQIAAKNEPFHRCVVCGITDHSHPDMDFRYCPKCAGTRGYCTEHIFNHEHVTADRAAASQ